MQLAVDIAVLKDMLDTHFPSQKWGIVAPDVAFQVWGAFICLTIVVSVAVDS